MQKGIATFTLDHGKCPPWLFERMVKLGREMTEILVMEYGPEEFVARIADPVWFQSLGTVLAFDWNASGLTTILTAALKEAIRGEERNLGIFICGGKGKTSRKTPDEIQNWGEKLCLPDPLAKNLVYNSKMSAKVDSSLVQDGFQIYHHSFFFTKKGHWTVVQQGMSAKGGSASGGNIPLARRYHWHSEKINDLVCEPHAAIQSETILKTVLDLSAKKSSQTRGCSTELVQAGYAALIEEIKLIRKYFTPLSKMAKFKINSQQLTLLKLEDAEFHSHPVIQEDFSKSKYLEKILAKLTQEKPKNYEQLLATKGVGPKTVRALALVSEVIYGARPSFEDPARYSFAHGGKDATPYPVDRSTYDQNIAILKKAVLKTRLSFNEKNQALKRLQESKV